VPRDLALATQRTHASPHQTLVTELEAAAIVEQWCLILHAASFGSQEWREDTRAAVKSDGQSSLQKLLIPNKSTTLFPLPTPMLPANNLLTNQSFCDA